MSRTPMGVEAATATPASGDFVNFVDISDSNNVKKATITDIVDAAAAQATQSITTLSVGASGTAGTLDIYPATASKGKLEFTCTNQTNNTTVTVNAAAMGQASTITIPDPGAASDTFALLAKAQTFTNKTFTDPIETVIKRCSAQVDKTDTTLANVTGLTGWSLAVGVYKFRFVLRTTCGGTGGVKLAFNFTTLVASAINYDVFAYTASAIAQSTGTTTTNQTSMLASNTAFTNVVIEGTITVGTAGTVDLQFAENSANSTSSVLVGSTGEFRRIS